MGDSTYRNGSHCPQRRKLWLLGLSLGLFVWLIAFESAFAVQSITADREHELLREYLGRNQLHRLELRAIELEFSRELDRDKRTELASELAAQYREFLLSGNRDTIGEVARRASALINEFPNLGTLTMRLSISHANYLNVESQFVDWWESGGKQNSRDNLLANLNDSYQELLKQIEDNNRQRTSLLADIPMTSSEKSDRRIELERIEARLIHANYLRGWISYFQAIVPFDVDRNKLDESHAAFYRVIKLERTETIDQVDKKWIDVSSPQSSRVFAGLAMVYAAQNKNQASRFCFEQIQPTRSQRFRSLVYGRQWTAAKTMAGQQGEVGEATNQPLNSAGSSNAPGPPRTRPSSEFWSTVYSAGVVAANFHATNAPHQETVRDLQRLGLLGLVRDFDGEKIRQLVFRHRIEFQNQATEDLWIQGLLEYQIADGNPEVLELARVKLEQAVASLDENFDTLDRSRMQLLLGLIAFEQGQFENAIELSATERSILDQDKLLAEKLGWLRCRALIELTERDNRFVNRALAALNQFESNFPGSSVSDRISFEKTRLTGLLVFPAEALAEWLKIDSRDPYFVEAQLEVVKLRHRVWSQMFQGSGQDKNREQQAYDELLSADRNYRSLQQTAAQDRLVSLYIAISASIQRKTAFENVAAMISQAEQEVRSLAGSSDNSVGPDPILQYYRFLNYRNADQNESANELASWLVENTENEKHEIAGLVFLAQQAEKRSAPVNEIIGNYEKLSERLGTDTAALASSRNARVVAARLVDLYIEQEKFQPALQLNTKLLNFKPDQQAYLLSAARIYSRSGDCKSAIPIWRRLSGASRAGSELWVESKFETIKCLSLNDSETATQVLRQTMALSGTLSDSWRTRFDALALQLQPANSQEIQVTPPTNHSDRIP